MSYEHRWSGEITIDPPIPVADLDGSWHLPDYPNPHGRMIDVQFRVEEVPVPEAPGAYRRMAVSVVAAMDSFSGYDVKEQLQDIVTQHGAGRTFGGHIEVQWEEEGASRFMVTGGAVQRVDAVMVWPGDEVHVVELHDCGEATDPLAAHTDQATAQAWADEWNRVNGKDPGYGDGAIVNSRPAPLNPQVVA